MPETTDIYDRKNMPRAIFCLHALSLVMYKNGSAPRIEDLFGRVQFTDAEITLMQVKTKIKKSIILRFHADLTFRFPSHEPETFDLNLTF